MPLPTTASYSMMVVDTLKPKPHVSHFGIKQAVQTARRVGAKRNYMVGFTHELNHDDWVAIGEALGQEDWITKAKDQPQPLRAAVELVEQGPPVWLRPAFDGMRVYVPEPDDEDQTIIDGYS
ncbi:hypothetical protein FRC02_004612 [Tulasnella sp. 418]|nr:hypothetical protein FRC02_004612 [Tulasnella sp. 418]